MKLLIFALTVSAVCALEQQKERKQFYDSKLFHHVQLSGLFPDSKTFVDLHMKYDERTILSAFDGVLLITQNKPTKEQLSEFINYYFDNESGLDIWTPSDFTAEPDFLAQIKDAEYRQFVKNIYNILPTLGRKIKPVVYENPDLFSIFPVCHGFIIPGGKSKEFYYGDSFWIVEALLISGMKDTAKGMISNFIDLQREFGQVPSGGRFYYLGRSHPPLTTAMVASYYTETNDIDFLKENIDALESELQYWLNNHSVIFNVTGKEYSLLRYISSSVGPRPESYYKDYINAQAFNTEEGKKQFYTNIKSAAESSWVYSSRWIINSNGSNVGDITSMRTTDIIPVDLNAIFANAAQNMACFYSVLNNPNREIYWQQVENKWINSINEVLFHEGDGIWYDFDLSHSQHRKYFYTSNFAPLWMGIVKPEFLHANSHKILNYIRTSHSVQYPGGVPTSLTNSGLQFDLPYAVPSQVSVFVNALEALETEESSKMAFEVAQNFIHSIYTGYSSNKQIYEKYDAEHPGKVVVDSGKYVNQEGFAPTIGVIMELLTNYGDVLTSVVKPTVVVPVYTTPKPEIVTPPPVVSPQPVITPAIQCFAYSVWGECIFRR